MSTNININVNEVQTGGSSKYSVSFQCHNIDKTVNCPPAVINTVLATPYNNSQISQAEAVALQVKTGGKGGQRSKMSKHIIIYNTLISLNRSDISRLVNDIGLTRVSIEVFRLIRSDFGSSVSGQLQSIIDSITSELVSAVEELLTEILDIIEDTETSGNVAFTECLFADSSANIVYDNTNNANVMIFNNDISYNSLKRYGVYAGTYTLLNIPQTQPIAILNSGIEDRVTYIGKTIPYYKKVNNINYKFYYNDISMTIIDDFTEYINPGISTNLSFYGYYSGYMGLQEKFTFTRTCAAITGEPINENINCIANSTIDISVVDVSHNDSTPNSAYYGTGLLDNVSDISYLYIFDNNIDNVFTLSDASKNQLIYDPSDIRLYTGSYIFNVPQEFPMLITPSGDLTNTSNQIFFNGNIDTSSVTFNNNIFYFGQTLLTVSGDFDQAKMYMLFDNNKVELQKPIIYDDTCFPKLKDSIINIIIQIQLEIRFFDNLPDNNTNEDIINRINSLKRIVNLISIIIKYLTKYFFVLGLSLSTQSIYTKILNIQTLINNALTQLNNLIIVDSETTPIFNSNILIKTTAVGAASVLTNEATNILTDANTDANSLDDTIAGTSD